MKIIDLSLDVYREECERASSELPELKDTEITEISLPESFVTEIKNIDFSECDTLVGAMRSTRQFGISLKRKFYHIPAAYAEEYPIPKYIALYQSQKLFGEEISGIKYYGEVKKCTPIRRNKIREIPKNSNELYYKFKIKRWERLEAPIASGELGFVRLFTNIFLLKNVDEVSALTISDSYEFYLYKLLKSANSAISNVSSVAVFQIEGMDVIFTHSIIYLCFAGKICERYYRSSLEETPSLVLRKLKNDIVKNIYNKSEQKHPLG